MSDFYNLRLSLVELENGRRRIKSKLTEVESWLSGLKKSSSKRQELIELKDSLLVQLREQNIRLEDTRRRLRQTPRNHAVTDHALVRWLERNHGIDVLGLKDAILTDELQAAIASGQEQWSDGKMLFVLQDGRVITVIPSHEWKSRALAL
ncbi:hypothetical protein [Zavarzinella formosa]|uniref:hypothetical protein n=1 Tax=Zavarzinella formosa TaxID=360055 RepID=UPI00036574FA|nr:hypothetical protein [Zavarzinella formosa]